jgi:hypothetical protein
MLIANRFSQVLARRKVGGGVPVVDATKCVLLLHLDGTDGATTFPDSSASAHSFTANGNAQIDDAYAEFGQSLLLDGSGDFIQADSSTDWDFGTGEFSIDFWARNTVTNPNYFGRYSGSFGVAANGSMYLVNTAAQCKFGVSDGTTLIYHTVTGLYTANSAWRHVALARVGDFLHSWLDGVYTGNTELTSGFNIQHATAPLVIGRYSANVGGYYTGHLDEFRIMKGQSSVGTASDPLYCGGVLADGFTPPTLPYVLSA